VRRRIEGRLVIQHAIENLQWDISLVQVYITNRRTTGFADMSRLLEGLSIKLFRATHGLVLTNQNLFKPNFPAIDIADDEKKTAIQVTSNADAKKVRHTLKQFDKFKLSGRFDTLIVFGFVNAKAPKSLPAHCKVLGVSDLMNVVIDKQEEEMVQAFVDAMEQHADFSMLHPYQDRPCLEIVLNCIDRNAVKHRMVQEGPYPKMVKGLDEISELISKGTIDKQRKNKSLDQFQDPAIRSFLSEIRDKVGRIVGIVNERKSPGGDFVDLGMQGRDDIDRIKQEIVQLSNAIARKEGLSITLQMH